MRNGLIVFFILGTTFFIAHTINAVVAEALFSPISSNSVSASIIGPSQPTQSASALAEQVKMSGLFPLPQVAVGPMGGGQDFAGSSHQPLNLATKLKLMGVVVGDRGGVSAIVEELQNRRQAFYRLHDQIPDVGEIVEVRRDGIVIEQGGRTELLELAIELSEKPPVSQTAAFQPGRGGPTGTSRKTLDRREVDQAMNDLPKLMSQARAVPYFVNGAMSGFRLDYIAPASFYERIGLRYGDVLKQVNGVEIKDPSTMLALFQQLRNEQSVKLDVLRNNQPTTMMFEIR